MWVPTPDSFNDPFDCSLMPGTKKTTEDGMYQLFHIIDELYDEEEAKKIKSEIFEEKKANPVSEVADNALSEDLEEAKKSGIFSMSEKNNNILMWSHYADEHKGFCIEFDRGNVKENFLSHFMCRPVEYVNKYPNLNRVVDTMDVNLFTKAMDWRYEAEWRLVTTAGNKILPLPAPITGIIFGMKASEESIKTIINSVVGQDINFYQAARKAGEYAVEINKI